MAQNSRDELHLAAKSDGIPAIKLCFPIRWIRISANARTCTSMPAAPKENLDFMSPAELAEAERC